MDNNFDNLKRFINTIHSIGFWNRLLGWRKVKEQLIDAATDLQKLIGNTSFLKEQLAESKYLAQRKTELELETATLKTSLQNLQADLQELKKQNIQLLKEEEFRKQEHSNTLSALVKIQEQVLEERNRETEEKAAAEVQRLKELKDNWCRHQDNVKDYVKLVCRKHTIHYIDNVPFKGEPDNTIMMGDEYVILDAKSPAGDEVKNFPHYLKDQAEKAVKYARQENVKADIFFVVPSNTLPHLQQFVYRQGDYTVFIIAIDAIEPVLLSLQKIETYEFAEQLSPEERENICRVLGRFAHLSKRRIQVDGFFAKQFIELAYKCENDLPEDILESVIEFERSEKLNPPQEKRAKSIPVAELEKENQKLQHETDSRGILREDKTIANTINEWPLYKET